MYTHQSTCVSCGNNFIVEVVPGQPMRQRGKCNDCRRMEWQQAEAARMRAEAARRAEEEARKRQMIKWGVIIGGPILLVLIIAFACST